MLTNNRNGSGLVGQLALYRQMIDAECQH